MEIWKCKTADLLYKIENGHVWCVTTGSTNWGISGFSVDGFIKAVERGIYFEPAYEEPIALENE